MMRYFLTLTIACLAAGCAANPDRVNSFSATAGPRCPGNQVAVVERRMMDDRYDCVDVDFFDQREMVNYDDDL